MEPTVEAEEGLALAIDAGRTLLIDRDELLRQADAAGIAIVGRAR